MKTFLTDRALKAMKSAAPGTRKMVWDAAVPSFGVRVTDKGKLTFIVLRRLHGKLVRRMLGQYPLMTLAEAREAALAALRDIASGVDPKQKKAEERSALALRQSNSFAMVVEDFIDRHISKLRSARAAEATIRRELMPVFGDRPVADITRRDIIAAIEKIARSGKLYAAHKAFAHITKFFSWCLARGILESSPCASIRPNEIIGAKVARQRVLADNEMAALWKATSALGYPAAPFVRLLILTGQRLSEVAEVKWQEFDLDTALWTIPAERMKGGIAHEVPMSNAVVEILQSLPRFTGGDFVFSTTSGRKAIAGFSAIKRRLDAAVPEIESWRFHDLRRSFRTGLGGQPVPPNVAEMCVAHAQPGMHRVYDRHSYRDEKRRAFELWAARLKEIVEPGVSRNVIPFR